ncbi:Nucleoside 5-triphosphatase RdgB [Citrifermentans bremense]|uniref:dITP/XTP pyrophosphatase n=1 Tax=Citrifermentans bremense TaxID=60035 RepID=A0A6S6M3F1_9BACT|nr:XTP/dITP diphosphatase [Citrifermentans bremense]BCG48160.1 Nucleoside 5-triphosphatase RdgB [Citrifermentans bremense]
MKELLVASGNKGKLREFEKLLEGVVETILSPAGFPGLPEVEEDGDTFESNALKKARSAALFTGKPVLADDSGLCVDYLGGRPGVYSARFAGEGAGDAANNALLLQEMAGVPQAERTGAFHCVIALCLPDGSCQTFDGMLKGEILEAPRGEGGFGYDPLFLVPEYGQTFSELPMEIKNAISHRGRAMQMLKEALQKRESFLR